MKKELIKLANHLDRIGLTKEADYIDNLLKKVGSEYVEARIELEARKELHSFIERLTISKGSSRDDTPESALRDFEKYLNYLNNTDIDTIDMMKVKYPKTTRLGKREQIGLVEQVIQRIKDIIDPSRYDI